MTQKEIQQNGSRNKIFNKVKYPRKLEGCSQKPVLLSSEDIEEMAVESARARLELFKNSEHSSREFGCYFRAPRKYSNTAYVATSHASTIPFPKRTIIQTFPTLVQNVMNRSVEISSRESISTMADMDIPYRRNKYSPQTCRCYNYERRYREAEEMQNRRRSLTNNIIQFSDNSTMTRKLHDVCCGMCIPISQTPTTSNATISTSDVAVRDQTIGPFSQLYSYSYAPILKRPEKDINIGHTSDPEHRRRVVVNTQDKNACNRQLTDYEALLESFSNEKDKNMPCLNNINDLCQNEQYGKNKKYQGINVGTEADCPIFSRCTKRKIPPLILNKKCSHVLKNKCLDDDCNLIPHAHNVHSKYHCDCKKTDIPPCHWATEDSTKYFGANLMIPKSYCCRATKYRDGVPLIKLPKKVLTSERDIESFIDKCRPRTSRHMCYSTNFK